MYVFRILFFICSISVSNVLIGKTKPAEIFFPSKMQIDLKNPIYKNGVLTTQEGGIIQSPSFYLQARTISYIRKDEEKIHMIEAYGDLSFRFGERIYVGDKLEFDLIQHKAVVYKGVTRIPPWFLGGEKIIVESDGSATITKGYLTTSEQKENEWKLRSNVVKLSKETMLNAKNITFFVLKLPLFWLPSLTTNLKTAKASGHTNIFPIHYQFRMLRSRPRLSLLYDWKLFDNTDATARVDFGIRGAGVGFESLYRNPLHKRETFSTFAYYAYDLRGGNSRRENRYRLQAKYTNRFYNDKIHCRATFDKVSDPYVPKDYIELGLRSRGIDRTRFQLWRTHPRWQAIFTTKVKANPFQSIKQELPLFEWRLVPYVIGKSGLLLYTYSSLGFLDYSYAKKSTDVHNFRSSRLEIAQSVSKKLHVAPFMFSSNIGYKFINYNQSPHNGGSKNIAFGHASVGCHTRLVGPSRQSIEPYSYYEYVTRPTKTPNTHYIFDINDGWYRLNYLRYGARYFLQQNKFLSLDIHAKTFFHTNRARQRTYLYGDCSWKIKNNLHMNMGLTYDRAHKIFNEKKLRVEKTFSEDLACAVEYRYRSKWALRKVDQNNFMIDSFLNSRRQRHLLTDQRHTFLTNVFFRISPNIGCNLYTRHGWGRVKHPAYNEYEIDVVTVIRNVLHVTFSIERRVKDFRFSVRFGFGEKKPSTSNRIEKFGQGNYALY